VGWQNHIINIVGWGGFGEGLAPLAGLDDDDERNLGWPAWTDSDRHTDRSIRGPSSPFPLHDKRNVRTPGFVRLRLRDACVRTRTMDHLSAIASERSSRVRSDPGRRIVGDAHFLPTNPAPWFSVRLPLAPPAATRCRRARGLNASGHRFNSGRGVESVCRRRTIRVVLGFQCKFQPPRLQARRGLVASLLFGGLARAASSSLRIIIHCVRMV
jgi:hypothetical protein